MKNNNKIVKKLIQDLIRVNRNQIKLVQRRKDIADNVIDIDYTDIKPPPLQKLEELDEADDDESGDSDSEGSDEDNGAEESVEKESNENRESKQDSTSASDADDDDNDSDYDEPPEGDGQGGGILGLLAGLSGVSLNEMYI